MLRSYFAIAIRFMFRQTGFTLINVFGLMIGMTCSLLILLYVQDELSYDRFHPDAEKVYRLGYHGQLEGRKIQSTMTGSPVAAGIENAVPEIESVIRLAHWPTFPLSYEGKAVTERYLLLADSNFFRFFNFELLTGSADDVLRGPKKVVISESAARRFFDYQGPGDVSPIGKTFILAQGLPAVVTGIAKDAPRNSHFHFSLILSLDTWEELEHTGWTNGKVITYFKLKPQVKLEFVKKKLDGLLDSNIDRELREFSHSDLTEFKKQGNHIDFFTQRLVDIHLRSHLDDEIEANGDIQYIYLFCATALFILLVACINFMNLSTARSAQRTKEVGIRKAVGGRKRHIVKQFLLESYLYMSISTILALLLVVALLKPFNYITGKDLGLMTFIHPYFILGAVVIFLVIGLLAGSYPAFYLTRFNPVEVLKGTRARLRSYGIRNVLVVFQFFISAGLIIATIAVYQQLRYLQSVDLGFEKENVINLLHTRNLEEHGAEFKKELFKLPSVTGASYSNRLPPNIDWQAVFKPVGTEKEYFFSIYEMDYDHLQTLGYSMVSGRFFSRDNPGDSAAVILNESALRQMKVTDYSGLKLLTTYDATERSREIIGVIKDFNTQSLKNPIQPMAVILGNEPNWEMAIRIRDGVTGDNVSTIETIWRKYAPKAAFEYTLLDKNFEVKQIAEQKLSKLFLSFTLLAILLACLGLYGLARFTAEQRTKEIGIRKVLGATVTDVGVMLNKDFLKLVVIANLIAWPFAIWAIGIWLRQFAYHVSMQAWFFLVTGLVTFIIATASVSYQAYKAARGNPVRSLRSE